MQISFAVFYFRLSSVSFSLLRAQVYWMSNLLFGCTSLAYEIYTIT